ncbi:MAG: plastocyanin/azurin family copper-binding protein [Thaumarchaeota archaeon]|nr:plastocyanin/azurin family copper-binding protein [Nitrososphaerota archaeon]
MEQENIDTIYRTTTTRTWKMLAIMIGLCISGSIIFFSMWDYWTLQPPIAGLSTTSISESSEQTMTGIEIPILLSFVESTDFRTLAFNALPGEENHNPEIKANVGDKIIFDVMNDGKSFHAFAVTANEEGFNEDMIEESKIASSSNPLKPGESGTSFFIPSEAGSYYYICTVPGHREQGMEGKILVTDVEATQNEVKSSMVDNIHREYTLSFVESTDFRTLAFNALPGEENHNPEIKANVGDTVTIKSTNNGKSFHAFGVVKNPENFNDVIWNSTIRSASNPLKPSEMDEVTFIAEERGTYYYICTVPGHALQGMQGTFIVE